MDHVNWVALIIFIFLFAFITWLGFAAASWRKGDLDLLHEWGLGGRRFGTIITWFLVGGDLYTAYTFIAVPALAYGAGAIAFFAVPYTIVIYPILFLVFPRLGTCVISTAISPPAISCAAVSAIAGSPWR
jgi:solute:Na+ symporter, SSS family